MNDSNVGKYYIHGAYINRYRYRYTIDITLIKPPFINHSSAQQNSSGVATRTVGGCQDAQQRVGGAAAGPGALPGVIYGVATLRDPVGFAEDGFFMVVLIVVSWDLMVV